MYYWEPEPWMMTLQFAFCVKQADAKVYLYRIYMQNFKFLSLLCTLEKGFFSLAKPLLWKLQTIRKMLF